MRWAVLVALLLVGLGAYTLMQSAHDLGMSVMADASEQTGHGSTPLLLDNAVRVSNGMAMLDLTCAGTTGCAGTVTITLDKGATGSAPYTLAGNRTTRYALPLPPGSRATRGELAWRETGGATRTQRIRLDRG
jgi:hypothetical protein